MGGEIVVTYETLFEVVRREKSRGELQELEADFLESVKNYLAQKKESLNEPFDDEMDRIQAEKQVLNIKRLMRELYEQRERKVIEMALNKSRTDTDLVDESPLLEEESGVYEMLVRELSEARKNILQPILDAQPKKAEPKEEPKEETVKLRCTEDIDACADKELEMHGPYHKDDVESFPSRLAELLLSKGCVEKIEE